MPAYIIVEIDVLDAVGYEEYKKLAGSTVEKYGGKYIVRGGKTEVLEGDWKPKRIVVLQFESAERAKEWLNCEEYREPRKMRHRTAKHDPRRGDVGWTRCRYGPARVVSASNKQLQAPTTVPARRIARSLSNLASLDFTRRISDNNAPGSDVRHRYRPCTNDRSFADCHPRPDECIRTNPCLRADHDRRTKQREIRLCVIVGSCANMSTMGDCYPRSERYPAEIVNERMLADRAFISRLEVPW
jgi:uncharacterized protein (DUF1330 family)